MPDKKLYPATTQELAPLFEALLRAIGGGVEMNEGRPLNLSGKLVVDRPHPGVVRIRTLDLAEGKWNPAEAIQELLTNEQQHAYAMRLAALGIRPVDISAITRQELKKELRDILDSEINQIIQETRVILEQREYLEALAEEEAEDERRAQQADANKTSGTPRGPRRVRRG